MDPHGCCVRREPDLRYSDGTNSSKDRVTQTEYDGAGNTIQLAAYNGSSTAKQDTVYLFEDSVAVNRNTSTIYPDSSDTTSSGSDQVKTTYNVDGSTATRTDQRGTVIAFAYDDLRRPQSQKVTTLGGSTDGTVRSITRGYDTLGRLAKITSHGNQTDDPDNTTDVENQVAYTYNNLSQITKSEQSHSGVVGGSTPAVQYTFSTSINGTVFNNGNRLETLTYPNGRALYHNYGTANALDDRLNIPQKLKETNNSGTQLVQYSHTGSGRTVITDYLQPDIKLDLFQGTSGTYAGLDRFGRTIDQFWDGYNSTADVARIKYGHDYASNRTWREDVIAENNSVDLDELYTYDGLNRLASVERGEINGTYTAITSKNFSQDWTLDQLGNWDNLQQDDTGNGTADLDQDRTHNDVNEITAITATTGANWVDPVYDVAGNTTTGPRPGDETTTQKYTYDAWNRMTKVTDGSDTTIAEYAYDGRNYRITKAVYSSGTLSHTDHYYYNEDWQALEVRRETSGTEDPDPREQYVWHPDYIDSLAVRYYDADTDGNLAENSDGAQYYTQGANYHVLAITNDSGSVLERYQYDPYGRLIVLDPDFTADPDGASDIDNPYTFTGRRLDVESRAYDFRMRDIDSSLGRFIERDPLWQLIYDPMPEDDRGPLAQQVRKARNDPSSFSISERVNVYAYVDNSPLSRLDALGMALYGNYCGPGGSGPVRDLLDEACADHDDCYGRCGAAGVSGAVNRNANARACDRRLCFDALFVDCSSSPTPTACRSARLTILSIFCANGTRRF